MRLTRCNFNQEFQWLFLVQYAPRMILMGQIRFPLLPTYRCVITVVSANCCEGNSTININSTSLWAMIQIMIRTYFVHGVVCVVRPSRLRENDVCIMRGQHIEWETHHVAVRLQTEEIGNTQQFFVLISFRVLLGTCCQQIYARRQRNKY